MTITERNDKLKHFIVCLKCEVSGKCCDDNCPTPYDAGNMGEIIENLEAISKALEQQPCEDAISRQAVIERINNAEENFKSDNMESIASDDGDPFVDGVLSGVFNIRQMVMQAPSVNPKPKTGKWIPDDTICEDTLYRCSNCDNVYYSDYGDVKDMGYNFCPNCGAKMESEDE